MMELDQHPLIGRDYRVIYPHGWRYVRLLLHRDHHSFLFDTNRMHVLYVESSPTSDRADARRNNRVVTRTTNTFITDSHHIATDAGNRSPDTGWSSIGSHGGGTAAAAAYGCVVSVSSSHSCRLCSFRRCSVTGIGSTAAFALIRPAAGTSAVADCRRTDVSGSQAVQ